MNNAQFWYGGEDLGLGDAIDNSIRGPFVLQNTYSSAPSDRKKMTFSTWFKRSRNAATMYLFSAAEHPGHANGSHNIEYVAVTSDGNLEFNLFTNGSTTPIWRKTSAGQLFDDTGWYHIFISRDTALEDGDERIKMFVNGIRVTEFTGTNTNPPHNNIAGYFGRDIEHSVGREASADRFDVHGYMAETIFLSETAVSSPVDTVGKFNDNGIWVPITPTFTSDQYGANGFRMTFADLSNYGKDTAPTGGNHSSANNYTDTVGNNTQSSHVFARSSDSPTKNFCNTMLWGYNNTDGENPERGGANIIHPGSSIMGVQTTFAVKEGKWYFEARVNNSSINGFVGVTNCHRSYSGSVGEVGQDANDFLQRWNGEKMNNTSSSSYGNSFDTGDILGVALDLSSNPGKIYFSKNGTWQNSGNPENGTNPAFSNLEVNNETFWIPFFGDNNTGSTVEIDWNFGAGQKTNDGFFHAAPSGYKTLHTNNLPEPTIKKPSDHVFDGEYSGNNTARTITACELTNRTLDFQPDLLWIKCHSEGAHWQCFDSCRGESKWLSLDQNFSETTGATDLVTAFNANSGNGFTLGANTQATANRVNGSGKDFVFFALKGGGKPTATNSAAAGAQQTAGSVMKDGVACTGEEGGFPHGTIAVTKMSVNTTAGFSIITWDGTGSAGTIPHGLGSNRPKMVVVKAYESSDEQEWRVWHHYFDSRASGSSAFKYNFASANAPDADSATWNSTPCDNADHVFNVGDSTRVNNSSRKYVAYCFAEVPGFSRFGGYEGNNQANKLAPGINTGFTPRVVYQWNESGGHSQYIHFSCLQDQGSRAPKYLKANSSGAAVTGSSSGSHSNLIFRSNGFAVDQSGDEGNESLATDLAQHLYFAFAERPFGGENTPPAPGYFHNLV